MNYTRENVTILIFMLATDFLANVSIGIVAPFLPKESELHGQSLTTTGAVMGFQSLVEAVFTIIWGRFGGKFGLRNSAVIGLALVGVTTISLSALPFIPHSATRVYTIVSIVIRTLQGISTAAAYNGGLAIVAVTFPKNNAMLLSLSGTIGAIGVVCGPAMGSGYFKIGGFWLVFAANGATMLLFSIIMMIFLPKIEDSKDVDQVYSVPRKKILLDVRILVCLVMTVFSAVKWSALDPILEPELRSSFGFTEDKSALLFLLLSGTFVITTPLAGKVIGKPYCMDSLLVMVIGLFVALPAFLLAGPCPLMNINRDIWLLMGCLSMLGLANCLIYVPIQDIMFNIERLKLSPTVNQTDVTVFITSLWGCCYSIGYFIGMTFSGVMDEVIGWAWTMTTYAGICIVLIGVILSVKLYELFKRNDSSLGYKELQFDSE